MSFKFPHLYSNKFSGLFNYKLTFLSWGSQNLFWSRLKAAGTVWAGETGRHGAEPVPLPPSSAAVPFPSRTAGQLPVLLSVRYSHRDLRKSLLLQKFGLTRVTPSLGLASAEGEKAGEK